MADPLAALMVPGDGPLTLLERVMAARPPWMAAAACATAEGVTFFPEQGQASGPAKAVCATCAVREACLDYAVTEDIRHGLWGGLSPRERARLRRSAA